MPLKSGVCLKCKEVGILGRSKAVPINVKTCNFSKKKKVGKKHQKLVEHTLITNLSFISTFGSILTTAEILFC